MKIARLDFDNTMMNRGAGKIVKSTKISYLLMFAIPMIVATVASVNLTGFLSSMWLDFDRGAYNHGFLLLLVTLYLLYSRIDIAYDISKEFNYIGFVMAVLLLILAFALEVVSIVTLQAVVIYLFVFFLVLAVYGWEVFKKAIFPLGLMLFALPIWNGLGPVLQRITLEMSYLMVKASGIPVLKDGFYLMIPEGNFEVAAGCSGFSYFMAAFPLALFYAVTNFTKKTTVFLVVGAIVIASIIANWVRVFIIIVAGHLTDMQHYFVTVEHFNLGWFIFALMFVALIFLFKRIPDNREEGNAAKTLDQAAVVEDTCYLTSRRVCIFSMALTVVGLTFIGFQYRMSITQEEVRGGDMAAGISVPRVFHHSSTLYELGSKINGAKEFTYVAYEYDPPIQLYHAVLTRQVQGKEVVSSENVLYNKDKWQFVNESVEQGNEIRKIELKSKLTGESYLLWSWYRVDSRNTVSDIVAKWYEFQGYLKGDNSGSIVSLLTPRSVDAERNLRLAHDLIVGA